MSLLDYDGSVVLLLDRYILKQFLLNFVILLGIMLSLFVVVDMLATADQFIEAGEVHAGDFGGSRTLATAWIVADFYVPMVLLLGVLFVGLAAFAAMGFTLHHLIRTRELTAMLTSGISMYRIAAPVLLAGGLVNLAALPIQELVIPSMADKLVREKSKLKLPEVEGEQIWYAPDGEGNLFTARTFDSGRGELTELSILVRASVDGQRPDSRAARAVVKARVTASQAIWDEQRGAWRLMGGHISRLTGLSPDESAGPRFGEAEILDWFESDLSPDVLQARRQALFPRVLSVADLMRLSRKQAADRDTFMRIAHSRFSFVILSMLLLMVGGPFFLLREPANLLLEGAKATLVGLGIWLISLVVLQLGLPGMGPFVSAWLPVLIIGPIAVAMFRRIDT